MSLGMGFLMNALRLAAKRNLSETDTISLLFQPALKLLTPISGGTFVMLFSEATQTKAKHPF